MTLPTTTARVTAHTREEWNEAIERATEERILWFSEHPEGIAARLVELDQEWDIERTLEANAGGIALAGLGLGLFVNRKFLVLPLAVSGFLLLHALQGWCPPLPLLRRMGVRTQSEIERERYALKALRGDFEGVRPARERSSGSKAFGAVKT